MKNDWVARTGGDDEERSDTFFQMESERTCLFTYRKRRVRMRKSVSDQIIVILKFSLSQVCVVLLFYFGIGLAGISANAKHHAEIGACDDG